MAEIKKYAVRFHGGPHGSGEDIRAQIHLFDASNKMAGWVDFYDVGRILPHDEFENEHIVLSLPMTALYSVIDVLRNEKPVYLYWQDKIKNGYLGTGQEEVGEGESSIKILPG